MSDALIKNGLEIDTSKLSHVLGIPVISVSAAKNYGIPNLIAASLRESEEIVKPSLKKQRTRDERYRYISSVVSECIQVTGSNKQARLTEKADALLTHPIFAIPIFLLIMLLIFQITFSWVGAALSALADSLVNVYFLSFAENLLAALGVNTFFTGLITEGIIAGLGSVVTFFPQLMLLFFFLSLMEDTGYMARTAFIMDKLFAKLGLSGKSFVPMIMGFGCSVPAIMAARTLESRRDRNLTILLLPFMSCSAKMPVYALFASVFFPRHTGIVIFSLYLLGMALAVLSGIIFSRTVLKGSGSPLLLELPPYRMPTVKTVTRNMLEKVKDFAARVGGILLLASIFIWLMQNLDFTLHMVKEGSDSIIGVIGHTIAPIFTPCGFGTPQVAVSLLSGVAAKEAILSSMAILYGSAESGTLTDILPNVFTPLSGYSFLVFVLLYVPCAAAVATLYTELRSAKLTAFSVIWQICAAWIISTLIFQIGSLFV